MLLIDATTIVVCAQTLLFSVVAGVLGVFVFLRSQSLVGDTISHASLPGIVSMFLLTHSTNTLLLLFGGAISGVCGILFIMLVSRYTTIKYDAILGIVLSVFFGCGVVLMTVAQKICGEQQSIINKFLFGSASTILYGDVYVMSVIVVIVLCTVWLLFKEFSLYVFDRQLAQVVGYPVVLFDVILNGLLIASIVVGLQTVGVILMSTMLVAPAAAARQWVDRLKPMMVVASIVAVFSSFVGVMVSSLYDNMPTGPTIAVILSCIVFVSLVCAPCVEKWSSYKARV